MTTIVTKRRLNAIVTMMELDCPHIARKAKPGQFVMVRPDEWGERIPLTIADYDAVRGTITIIYQRLGLSTRKLDRLEAGDRILDVVGPLGNPTETGDVKRAMVIGGGVGCAIAYPQAKALHAAGAEVDVIIGFRTKDLVFMEDQFRRNCTELYLTTDDGSYGEQGNVTVPLKEMLEAGEKFDMIITIGPLIMMKYVVATAKPFGTPVTASMNPIMIDGTGMCGGCRLTLNIDGKKVTKFACVDGPDFNGYEIDFDEAMSRGRMYGAFERHAYESACNLYKKEVQ